MTLVYIPEGQFIMGSDADDAKSECSKYTLNCSSTWFSNEEPPHQVFLDAFWIDSTEITNAMYAECVNDGICTPPYSYGSFSRDSYFGDSAFDNFPVIEVTWNDANNYCSWARRRLPTEAEWEKSARGTDTLIYPWGNAFDGTYLNFCDINCFISFKFRSWDDGYGDTAPVGSYPTGASPFGLLDLAGNVSEWVDDWYDAYPGGNANPNSAFGRNYRVTRGGSWFELTPYSMRTTARGFGSRPDQTSSGIGFRCAMSATP
jgi:formylglycine-generating enzyme required for sulfatase activity